MIILGQYLPGETPLHRLDPRVKIGAVMVLSLLIFAATPAGIALISLFLAAVIRTARLTVAQTAAALRPVAIFMALIFLMHLLGTEGTPLIALSPLPLAITREGIMQAAIVTWQFAALVIGAAILTMTTLPTDLVGGVERLLRPLSRVGIPSQEIAVMIALAFRFVPLLLEEYDRLRTAQLARGGDFTTGGVRLRTRAVMSLTVALLFSAFRRADEFTLAMEARDYRRGPRTTLRELKMTGTDTAAFAVMVALVLMNFGLRIIA
ncbi:MAG: energy-coupling factor transporter transmembrane component T family protein [Syntrophales bacterium]